MKHEKKKTKVGEKLDPLAAELHVEETFSKNYAEKNLHYRRRESQQPAEAGQNGRGQGDKEKRFSLIEDHNGLPKKGEIQIPNHNYLGFSVQCSGFSFSFSFV
jgi:hypothetical protein